MGTALQRFVEQATPSALMVIGTVATALACSSSSSSGGSIPESPTLLAIAAKLAPSHPDAGDRVMPTTHEFSLLVDWTGKTATTGSGGTANQAPIVYHDGVWTTQAPLQLSLALATRPFVTYDWIAITPTPIGCVGQAAGRYDWNATDVLYTIPFDATIAGVPDQVGPVLSAVGPTRDVLHPLDQVGVMANELLPAGTTAHLVASDGSHIPTVALPSDSSDGSIDPTVTVPSDSVFGVSGFMLKERGLAFASTYSLGLPPSFVAVDLAGNISFPMPSFTTMPGPGLLAQDGFETAVDALLGGKVAVVDSTTLPIPAGTKALRFSPTNSLVGEQWSCDDRFTARLSVPSGATFVKFSTLFYGPTSLTDLYSWGWLQLAVPNGAVSDPGQGWSKGGTALPIPWTGTLPGGDSYNFGDLMEQTFALPPGTTSEVIVDLRRRCAEPFLGGSLGLVIDNLRVE